MRFLVKTEPPSILGTIRWTWLLRVVYPLERRRNAVKRRVHRVALRTAERFGDNATVKGELPPWLIGMVHKYNQHALVERKGL